jgi:hypothetical protein
VPLYAILDTSEEFLEPPRVHPGDEAKERRRTRNPEKVPEPDLGVDLRNDLFATLFRHRVQEVLVDGAGRGRAEDDELACQQEEENEKPPDDRASNVTPVSPLLGGTGQNAPAELAYS